MRGDVALSWLNSMALLSSWQCYPDVGQFSQATRGEYQLVELKERITPHGYFPLPEVAVVDLREELKSWKHKHIQSLVIELP